MFSTRLGPIWSPLLSRVPCRLAKSARTLVFRGLHSGSTVCQNVQSSPGATVEEPFRKQLKAQLKQAKKEKRLLDAAPSEPSLAELGWELTVGIEIHAQLNSRHKLFSNASHNSSHEPNDATQLFDIATPGAQPQISTSVILPAVRAALALNCKIQPESFFDRKHYFYRDQPAGYQVTQFYKPFAKNGLVTVHVSNASVVKEIGHDVRIKQIQLEQDTAKTNLDPTDAFLLDFNRSGSPLIEIISEPDIHDAKVASAYVRSVQAMLKAAGAVNIGMEDGGLRADVNISVNHRDHGPGLGQRTEIKNLNSFKSIEDAIEAEMQRQVQVLQSGSAIKSETRGWTIGATETTLLRSKEGEVDYRYMPDPDLPALRIEPALVEAISRSLPLSPKQQLAQLVMDFNILPKDAQTLILLEDGQRLDYYMEVYEALVAKQPELSKAIIGRKIANWVIHELGGLLNLDEISTSITYPASDQLADIINHVETSKISASSGKKILKLLVSGDSRPIRQIVQDEGLLIKHLDDATYANMAKELLEAHPDMVQEIRNGQERKLQWFVGQMLRKRKGGVDASKALQTLRAELKLPP